MNYYISDFLFYLFTVACYGDHGGVVKSTKTAITNILANDGASIRDYSFGQATVLTSRIEFKDVVYRRFKALYFL